MKLSEIIDAVRDAVAPWVKEQGGVLTVAKDPWHGYEIISAGSPGLLLVLGYGGRDKVDGAPGNPLAQKRIELLLGNGMGLDIETGRAAFQQTGPRAPLVDLMDDLTQKVCEIDMQEKSAGTTGPRFIFEGDEPVELPNGIRLAAYRLRFTIVGTVLTTPQPI